MAYKTLLIHVESSPEGNHRLRVAVDLAKRLSATLIGVGGSEPLYLDQPTIMTGYGDGDLIQALTNLDAQNLRAAEARFVEATRDMGSSAIWLSDVDYPDKALDVVAAGADLIIASAKRGPRASTAAAASAILDTGLPVLTIPTDLPAISIKKVLVAWKNTPEARRAVSDALPLLIGAERVTLLRVHERSEPDQGDPSLDIVAGKLRRHGIQPFVESAQRRGDETSFALTDYAEANLFDLIVAGAYGRPRLGEWALGGVTQSLLAHSPLPVLFSH